MSRRGGSAARKDPAWKGFARGALAAMVSGAVTHPIDLVKVRMQLYGEGGAAAGGGGSVQAVQAVRAAAAAGPGGAAVAGGGSSVSAAVVAAAPARASAAAPGMLSTAAQVARSEGVKGLYKGLSASLMRQGTFIGAKFGLYEQWKVRFADETGFMPFQLKIAGGFFSGAVGAVIGNPADLAMVRMQADGRLPPHLRRNYRHGGEALYRVMREEGVLALWRGSIPTASRACIITAAQFSVYEECKERLVKYTPLGDNPLTHGLASFACAIVAGLVSNPFDVAKTRLMSMKIGEDGSRPYTGTFQAIGKIARQEGAPALMKGLGPTVARQVPLNLVRFMTVEQLRKIL